MCQVAVMYLKGAGPGRSEVSVNKKKTTDTGCGGVGRACPNTWHEGKACWKNHTS